MIDSLALAQEKSKSAKLWQSNPTFFYGASAQPTIVNQNSALSDSTQYDDAGIPGGIDGYILSSAGKSRREASTFVASFLEHSRDPWNTRASEHTCFTLLMPILSTFGLEH